MTTKTTKTIKVKIKTSTTAKSFTADLLQDDGFKDQCEKHKIKFNDPVFSTDLTRFFDLHMVDNKAA